MWWKVQWKESQLGGCLKLPSIKKLCLTNAHTSAPMSTGDCVTIETGVRQTEC
jgi:hypothetical protein